MIDQILKIISKPFSWIVSLGLGLFCVSPSYVYSRVKPESTQDSLRILMAISITLAMAIPIVGTFSAENFLAWYIAIDFVVLMFVMNLVCFIVGSTIGRDYGLGLIVDRMDTARANSFPNSEDDVELLQKQFSNFVFSEESVQFAHAIKNFDYSAIGREISGKIDVLFDDSSLLGQMRKIIIKKIVKIVIPFTGKMLSYLGIYNSDVNIILIFIFSCIVGLCNWWMINSLIKSSRDFYLFKVGVMQKTTNNLLC